jgi:hypothetical protein
MSHYCHLQNVGCGALNDRVDGLPKGFLDFVVFSRTYPRQHSSTAIKGANRAIGLMESSLRGENSPEIPKNRRKTVGAHHSVS